MQTDFKVVFKSKWCAFASRCIGALLERAAVASWCRTMCSIPSGFCSPACFSQNCMPLKTPTTKKVYCIVTHLFQHLGRWMGPHRLCQRVRPGNLLESRSLGASGGYRGQPPVLKSQVVRKCLILRITTQGCAIVALLCFSVCQWLTVRFAPKSMGPHLNCLT